jgi:hypothetical protein
MIHKSPVHYTHRRMVEANAAGKDSGETRLALDLADLLTGPTSGSNAQRLAEAIVRQGAAEVVTALEQACKRYRGVHRG